MRSDWHVGTIEEIVDFENRRRIPLSAAQRAARRGEYPYWGANGPFDVIDDFLFEGARVLVAEDGNTVVRPDGRGTVHWATGRYWVNNHAHVLNVKPGNDLRWLFYALSTARVRDFVSGSAQPKLSMGSLKRLPLRVPPYAEQRRIASILGVLDDKIDSNRRLAGLLEETAAALFRARFVDFVGVEEFEDSELGPIPRGWRTLPISMLGPLRYGKALPAKARRPGAVAVVGSSGVVGSHDECLLRGPAVIVGRKGTAGSVVWVGGDAWPIDTTFYVDPAGGFPPVFVYYALRHADLPHLTSDSAVPGLNRDAAEQHLVTVPPIEPVREFADVANVLFASRDRLNWESETLSKLRDALLPKLVSGAMRVPDTTDPAEVVEPMVA